MCVHRKTAREAAPSAGSVTWIVGWVAFCVSISLDSTDGRPRTVRWGGSSISIRTALSVISVWVEVQGA